MKSRGVFVNGTHTFRVMRASGVAIITLKRRASFTIESTVLTRPPEIG
jgi:hypothetical protein